MTYPAYDSAVAFLHSLIRGPATSDGSGLPYGAASQRDLLAIRMRRMARMRFFLSHLGNPERSFLPFHVGGTSGKGSTAAMIHAILQRAGRRTGLHVSPYLQVPLEKLVIGDQYLGPSAFADLVDWMRPLLGEVSEISPYGPPSYGEVWVALTFACFERERVEAGVVEVGHGGRWDYTNVLTPAVSVITTVGMDHVRSLGPTLADIAHHKAGIIKYGRPAVVGRLDAVALEVVEAEASTMDAPMWVAGRDFDVAGDEHDLEAYRYEGPAWSIGPFRLALAGRHQAENAAAAIAAVEASGVVPFAVARDAIPRALGSVRFPGRLEVMQRSPIVVLDGAHNVQKAEALARELDERYAGRRLILVFGALAAKQADDMLAILAPRAGRVITTAPAVYQKASADPHALRDAALRYAADAVAQPDPLRAIDLALDAARPDDLVCVTGSLYLVGAIRERWVSTESILAAAEAGLPPP